MEHAIFPAHIRADGKVQTVEEHSEGTARIAAGLLDGINLQSAGEFAGLLHDMGKLKNEFAAYIGKAANGEKVVRGSVNHTFSAVRWIYENYAVPNPQTEAECFRSLTAELIAAVVGAHHGQFDCINPDGENGVTRRLTKEIGYAETLRNFSARFDRERLDALFDKSVKEVAAVFNAAPSAGADQNYRAFMLYRIILSALIEADRSDTAEFEKGLRDAEVRATRELWKMQLETLEEKLEKFPQATAIDRARGKISDRAAEFSVFPSAGIFQMSVPTGGGKTLSSLRAALAHAAKYGKKRIIFTIPLLTLLEQNARAIRSALQNDDILLEHHSNVLREKSEAEQLDSMECLTENWHSPVIITTLVQFLNTLFDGRTSCIRRLHSLIDSIVVMDEVQTVPRKMLSMFNEAINFLAETCGCAVLLCSATQPYFEGVSAHAMRKPVSIVPPDESINRLFRRTEIKDLTRPAMTAEEIAGFIEEKNAAGSSVLAICNTKAEAAAIYRKIKELVPEVYHMSASMCPAHRENIISQIKTGLANGAAPVCISTQVMEAGIDISFGCVIRIAAGLDNVIQAAGRCNRNGESGIKEVYCINYKGETLSFLKDIEKGRRAALALFDDFRREPDKYDRDLQSDKAVKAYYQKLYRSGEANEFDFPVPKLGPTVYSMLSDNAQFAGKARKADFPFLLRQAFKTAGERFCVFENNTVPVIVPYGEGKEIIKALGEERAGYDFNYLKSLLQRAKRYTVSIYASQEKLLRERGGINPLLEGRLSALSGSFYNGNTGVDENAEAPVLMI